MTMMALLLTYKWLAEANEMSVKTRQINTHTGTADAVIQPAKNFPYIAMHTYTYIYCRVN